MASCRLFSFSFLPTPFSSKSKMASYWQLNIPFPRQNGISNIGVVGPPGLEPGTFAAWGRRPTKLDYEPSSVLRVQCVRIWNMVFPFIKSFSIDWQHNNRGVLWARKRAMNTWENKKRLTGSCLDCSLWFAVLSVMLWCGFSNRI